ncbi:MAG: nucleotidyl transferase AbiEii/AbiGii toxin family protein [Bacteroidia bacterium]|nr:nucleotidyl transferase AbiEii/AbiGii toxin family protein [Bacteroidia bacterium]
MDNDLLWIRILITTRDKYSEDLDFDCKNLSKEEFSEMTDAVLLFLRRSGWRIESRDKNNDNLSAYRRTIYFPELLFELGLSGHKEERFLIKVESEDQMVEYTPVMAKIKGCGFYFSFPVPDDRVLCAMKISALVSRQKGRDFYDAMFLLAQSSPDYNFLAARCGIRNLNELKAALGGMLEKVNLSQKSKDFEHLLFRKTNSQRILAFGEFVDGL